MTKAVIEKVASSSSQAAVFKVGGTLGYHENQTLKKFFEECKKRRICKLILDFSSLNSLGGGCAKIIREAAEQTGVKIMIAGASSTVLHFLKSKEENNGVIFTETVEDALKKANSEDEPVQILQKPSGHSDRVDSAFENQSNKKTAPVQAGQKGKMAPSPDSPPVRTETQKAADEGNAESRPAGEPSSVIFLGLDASDPSESGCPQRSLEENGADEAMDVEVDEQKPPDPNKGAELRELKRKLIHYNTLLTISSDFNRIEDRISLLDAFLLTTIAQIGVESAAFFEAKDGAFVHTASKGIETPDNKFPVIDKGMVNLSTWSDQGLDYKISSLPIDKKLKDEFRKLGFSYAAPFIIHENMEGIILLGKSIKKKLESDWGDLLRVLMNQVAISYEKTKRLEQESERTLGLVHTLISLIEENTLGRGTTDLVANYTYALASRLQYPKEYLKDLMFGTVLRDIGMIKVSDLIVRSPRELVKEEWEIIKRHPSEGAEMLKKMRFSKHTTDIVLYHHERFNGEGYPAGLEGTNIPLGARIVSLTESYAAMLRDRPNRPALKEEEALNTLRENWGLRYDPEVVKHFVALVEEERRSKEKIKYNHSELFRIQGDTE